MKTRHPIIAAILFAVSAASCAVGPDYHPPSQDVPAHWSEAQTIASSRHAPAEWWKAFNDPELASLIDRAMRANLGLRLAAARVREARAQRRIVAAPLWPSANTAAAYTRRQEDEDLFGPLAAGGQPVLLGAQPENLFEAGFDASWEIDLFGGRRRAVEAAGADLEASRYDYGDVLLTLLAEVARNYIELRGDEQRLAIARRNLAAERDTLELTRARYHGGFANGLDVARVEAAVAAAGAQLPALTIAYREALHRLGVLLGEPPGALTDELAATRPIPMPPPELPADLPLDMLRQRPDLRRAERQLAAATARIGVATAELYPHLSLVGAAGLESLAASDFFNSSSKVWSIGPSITWPIFRGGQIVAMIEVRDAQTQEALIGYRQALLHALEEVENAFAASARERDRHQALAAAVAADQHAVALATQRYDAGLTDFLSVLDTQRDLLQAQMELTQSDATEAADMVALYKALGGGWEAAAGAQLASSANSLASNAPARKP